MKGNTLLFDMDGTLTPHREKMSADVEYLLQDVLRTGVGVGIVTGSGIDYIQSQIPQLNESRIFRQVRLFPCNGTQVWESHAVGDTREWRKVFSVSMEESLGDFYYELLQFIFYAQGDLCKQNSFGMPLTGHFVSPRGSMINWSPVGRNASKEERNKFVELDARKSIRKTLCNRLNEFLEKTDNSDIVSYSLGGQTSIDIYPQGWDKTFVKRHYNDDEKLWFIGDSCKEGGNDHSLFKSLEPRSFETTGPDMTLLIIENILAAVKNL